MRIRFLGSVAALALLLMIPVAAHHAVAAQYDIRKPIEVTGSLKKMEFINPHSMLHLDVANPDGTTTTWMFQTNSSGTLRQRRLERGSLEPSAKYTIKGYAARNGSQMVLLRTQVFPDEREVV